MWPVAVLLRANDGPKLPPMLLAFALLLAPMATAFVFDASCGVRRLCLAVAAPKLAPIGWPRVYVGGNTAGSVGVVELTTAHKSPDRWHYAAVANAASSYGTLMIDLH